MMNFCLYENFSVCEKIFLKVDKCLIKSFVNTNEKNRFVFGSER